MGTNGRSGRTYCAGAIRIRFLQAILFLLLFASIDVLANPPAVPAVAPVDWNIVDPSQFDDEEMDTPPHAHFPLPYYLAHLHEVANSVRVEEPNRGFIDIPVWRSRRDNAPGNIRIMENVLSLAWFYATNRPWNVYYGDEALRGRLELALGFLIDQVDEEGNVPFWRSEGITASSEAFLTKYLGKTLEVLEDAPPIDTEIHEQLFQVQRRILLKLLGSDDFVTHGSKYSNQYGNLWPGALAYLALREDPQVRELFDQRVRETRSLLQSPAGFFYENHGPDWNYAFVTHSTNVDAAWHYLRESEERGWLIEESRNWFEWNAYNVVLEPGGSGFFLNRAIETRSNQGFLSRLDSVMTEELPLARAFASSREEVSARRTENRRKLTANWPSVDALRRGFNRYGPYAFLFRDTVRFYPPEEERAEARKLLPYLADEQFTHQRVDDRRRLEVTFVRRPAYYAIFNAGLRHGGQRLGLGLVWHPEMGTVLQSQSRGGPDSWGIRGEKDRYVREMQPVDAVYRVNDRDVEPVAGIADFPLGDLSVTYGLGGNSERIIRFEDQGIVVAADWDSPFSEQIPLLVGKSDQLSTTENGVRLIRNGYVFLLSGEGFDSVTIGEVSGRIGNKEIVPVELKGKGNFTYTIQFYRE